MVIKRRVKTAKIRKPRRGRKLQQKSIVPVIKGAAVAASAMAAYRGRSRTKAKTRTEKSSTGFGDRQWTTQALTKTFGRQTRKKLESLRAYGRILKWSRLDNHEVGFGRMWMNNYWSAGNASSLPLYVIDLTSNINTVNGGISLASPVLELTRTDGTSPAITWLQRQSDALQSEWSIERETAATNTITNMPQAVSLLEWADIRMDLFGCTTSPCKWVIELCQLDEDIVPVPGGTISDSSYVRHWDNEIRSFVTNPNMATPGYAQRGMKKVWMRKVYMMNPSLTNEVDPSPELRTVKYFFRFNRICRYQWRDWINSNSENPTNANFTGFTTPTVIADNQTLVHPKARIYLMIRCTKYTRNALATDQNNTNTPSLNLQVRIKHKVDS